MTQEDVSLSLLPRMARLLRLLMQLRFVLTGLALLLLPQERLTVSIALLTILFAALTALVAWQWKRITPYLYRHPLLVTLDIFCAAAILGVDGPAGPFFVATVLTSTVAGLLFRTWGVVGVVSFQILCYTSALLSYSTLDNGQPPEELVTFQTLLVNPALYPVAGFVGAQLRRIFLELATEQRKRQEAEITAASAEERARLARDMHDSVTKTLRGAAMAAQSLPIWVEKDPERARATAHQIMEATDRAAQEAREIILDLREESSTLPLADLVQEVVEEWSAESGVPARVERAQRGFPLMVTARHETVAIVREALTNVSRHANARTVTVTLAAVPDTSSRPTQPTTESRSPHTGYLFVRIADDGDGFEPSSSSEFTVRHDGLPRKDGHYGTAGMAERAERAGGALAIESTPGAGTSVLLWVPLAPEEDHASPGARDTTPSRAAPSTSTGAGVRDDFSHE
ncbi:sensor histidine kinase [Halostreptopolyspora alba]|uniref:histidine kinase n=1 Tax=Halostreptopolyspora alba TaxID=2487137 RepID=A0A3N0E6V6_9ACTN|nr:sensor histidine kinase [Nocardiopsaceae bacterium YIM 96095]